MREVYKHITAFCIGAMTASLLITHSDNWKMYMPLAILSIFLYQIYENDEE